MKTKYPGDDISFVLNFEKGEDVTINGFNDFKEIIVHCFTNSCFISKFRYPEKEGYNTLAMSNDTTISGTIPTRDSKLFSPGSLVVGILCTTDKFVDESDNDYNQMKYSSTGINISKFNTLKTEV